MSREIEATGKKDTSSIAVEALVGRLKIENDSKVRCRLVEALAAIGEQHQAEIISAELADVINDPVAEVRACVLTAFGQIEKVPDRSPVVLLDALDDSAAEVRAASAGAIGSLAKQLEDEAARFVKALTLKLSDPNPLIRKNAMAALGRFGAQANDAVDSILEVILVGPSDIDAIEALGAIGPGAAPAVTTLSKMLDRRNLERRDDKLVAPIIRTLGRIGPAAKPAAPSVIRILKSDNEYWQNLAIDASGEIQLAETVPLLVDLWPRPVVTTDRVVEALSKIGIPAITHLDEIANARDLSIRQRALELLTLLSPTSLPVLLARLNSEDPQTRRDMVVMVGKSIVRTPEIVAPLIRALGDEPIAQIANETLVAVGEPAVEGLGQALVDGGPASGHIAEVLLKIGPSAAPVLIAALDSNDPFVVHNAAAALGGLGSRAKDAIPKLTALLAKDVVQDARPMLIIALGKILARPMPRTSLFRKITEDDPKARPDGIVSFLDFGFDPERFQFIARANFSLSVRTSNNDSRIVGPPKSRSERMQVALGFAPQGGERFAPVRGITPTEPVPALLKALTDEDVNVRRTAVFALLEMAPQSPDVVKGLIEALNDKDVMVRRGAASALGAVQTKDREAVLALADALLDDDDQEEERSGQGGGVGARAAAALAAIGPSAAPAVPALIQVIAHGTGDSQHDRDALGNAALALGRIGPAAAKAAPALRALLERRVPASGDGFAEAYHNAALAIGRIGADPPESIPILIKLLGDSNESVQWAAAEALSMIAENHQDRMETAPVELLKSAQTAVERTEFEPQKQIIQRAVSFLTLAAERDKWTGMALTFLKAFGALILAHLVFLGANPRRISKMAMGSDDCPFQSLGSGILEPGIRPGNSCRRGPSPTFVISPASRSANGGSSGDKRRGIFAGGLLFGLGIDSRRLSRWPG